jgi:hypothetical protein
MKMDFEYLYHAFLKDMHVVREEQDTDGQITKKKKPSEKTMKTMVP